MHLKNQSKTEASWAAEVIHGDYFPHIDGIRTLAVVPVVLYHIAVFLCPGGFTGVDVFFVISGYLISGGIIKELRAGKFSMVGFLNRRVKRIIPAYFVLIAVVFLFGMAVLHYEKMLVLGKTTFSSVLFATNIYFFRNTNYFAPNSHENPLLNLWSLSVEEQFYFLLPVTLLVIWKWRRSWLVPILWVTVASSFLISVLLIHRHRLSTCFYWLPPRAWELLAGTLLSLAPRPTKDDGRSTALSVTGLILILVPFFSLSHTTPFPGMTALPSVLGTCLLIRYGHCGLTGRLLSSKPFVGIGKISYSLYLWHWPIIVFWTYIAYLQITWADRAGMIALSMLLAWMSWKWVETPVRRVRGWKPIWSAGLVVGSCLLVGSVSLITIKTDGFKNILHIEANRVTTENYWVGREFKGGFGIQPPQLKDGAGPAFLGLGDQTAAPELLLWGDSHAKAIAPGFDDMLQRRKQSGLFLDRRHFPLSGVEVDLMIPGMGADFLRCRDLEPIFEWLSRTDSIKTVVLACRWSPYCEGTGFGAVEPFPAYCIFLSDSDRKYHSISENRRIFEAGLRKTCLRLRSMGKQVILFDSIPELNFYAPEFLRKSRILPTRLSNDLPIATLEQRQKHVQEVFKAIERSGDARVFWNQNWFRNGDLILAYEGDCLFYIDDDHVSPTGARRILSGWVESLGF